jgi:hypothetical protein
MVENEDHFKFFIEDDKTFDDYIKHMSKDGIWGGNLEIYALSMKLTVNFYIHIYNHPMYIVRNWDHPFKNVHLSYHDGEHYNSVRLKDDLGDDIPMDVPLELINCVEQTSDVTALLNLENGDDDENENDDDETRDKENDNDNNDSNEENKNKKQNEEGKNNPNENENEINIAGTIIKDFTEKDKKLVRSIMTEEGIVLNDQNDFKKCHCNSNKKYKNCCISTDIKGEYDKDNSIFYCDIELLKSKFNIAKFKKSTNTNSTTVINTNSTEIGAVSKAMEKIFI